MTTSTQQKMPAQLGAYPKISDRDALAGTLAGLTAVSVCGALTRAEQTRLQTLVRAAGDGNGCRLVFVASPSLEAPRETLLYPAHLTVRQTEKLLRQLYDADALICGILPASLLAE